MALRIAHVEDFLVGMRGWAVMKHLTDRVTSTSSIEKLLVSIHLNLHQHEMALDRMVWRQLTACCAHPCHLAGLSCTASRTKSSLQFWGQGHDCCNKANSCLPPQQDWKTLACASCNNMCNVALLLCDAWSVCAGCNASE